MSAVESAFRRPFAMSAVAVLLAGLGFAVRYGEDNHIGESNVISWWIFVAAGLFAYWALIGFVRRFFRRGRGGSGR